MDGFDLFQLTQQFHGGLRAAYARGQAEYGELPLEFDDYAQRLVAILVRRLGPGASRDRLEQALELPSTTDLYLAIACETKAAGAWEVLSQRFCQGLKAMALRSGAAEPEAEELARELPGSLVSPPANGKAATRIGTYDGSGSLFAWLTSVAHRRYQDRLRKARTGPAGVEGQGGADPGDVVVGAETGLRLEDALRRALLDLTLRESLLLVWKYRDNLPQHEMAARLGVSEPRVSQLLKRTVEKVRRSVLERIQDESAPQWASREQLWGALRNVVGRLLEGQ